MRYKQERFDRGVPPPPPPAAPLPVAQALAPPPVGYADPNANYMQHTEHVVREAGKEIDRLRHEIALRDDELGKVRRDADGLGREVSAARRELQVLKEIELDCQTIQDRGCKEGLLPPVKEAKSLLHVMYEASFVYPRPTHRCCYPQHGAATVGPTLTGRIIVAWQELTKSAHAHMEAEKAARQLDQDLQVCRTDVRIW